MRYPAKLWLVRSLHLVTWPFALVARIGRRGDGDGAFAGAASLLSLMPGRIGQALRASFYLQTLAHSSADLSVGFLSFLRSREARVGRGVYVGSMSVIGRADIGSQVLIGSRATISETGVAPVCIGDHVWVGEGAHVEAHVGNHSIVGAGAVVGGPVPEGSVATGHSSFLGNPPRREVRQNSRYSLKRRIVRLCHVFTWPLALSAVAVYRWFGSEVVFDFGAKLLSLIPGGFGRYLRTSYYVLTLPKCGYDLLVHFASFITHITTEIGRGVSIGSFAIVGTCVIGNNVMVGTRVSILSGKYHHGGGGRGRDFKRNTVYYEQVRIGEGSWLGEGCIVMCNVGRNVIVSAGSVVTKPAPDGVTAVGNPARFVRYDKTGDDAGQRKLVAITAICLAGLLAGDLRESITKVGQHHRLPVAHSLSVPSSW